MTAYLQAVAGALLTAVMCLLLSKYGKDLSVAVSLLAAAMVLAVAGSYLRPVISLIHSLQQWMQGSGESVSVMLKATGLGLLGQMASLLCNDAGNTALGRAVETVTAAVILTLSVPLIQQLLELIVGFLGAL